MEYKKVQYDLVVCGGGIPGVCAAITAARNGVKTAIMEQRPILGGNSSSLALVPPHGAASMWHNRMAREGGILEELLMEYAHRSPLADNRRIWDLILREWCEKEPNLNLYLNARLDKAKAENNRIISVTLTQTTTETIFDFEAPLFVDATGDAFLAQGVNAEFRIGRESKKEFGESLAPEKADSKTLPSALYVIAHRRSRPSPYHPPEWVPKHDACDVFPHRPHVIDKFSKGKALTEDASAIQLFWWCSLGGEKDTIKDSEEIYKDLVKEAMGIWDHLKNRCTPETREALKNYEAVWWSPFPLRRESRRVVGDHILVENDIFEATLFEDRVSHGGWPVDVHPPEGMYSKEPPCDQTFVNELYSVPFSIMYSKNITNLMLAGRCISMSHVAMGSIRVMNSLGAAAHAVGMAAALCIEKSCDPREVRTKHIKELQQRLLKVDAHIINLKNEDPADLARKASVSVSSELKYHVEAVDDYVELTYDLAQQLPVSQNRIESVSIPLKSNREDACEISIRLYTSGKMGRFDTKNVLFETKTILKSKEDKWLEFKINKEIPAEQLLWICLEKQAGVFWGYSKEETFGTRFAAKFHGDLVPLPSHGKAQIAPINDDWFPINHNGRLPGELHRWIDATIGIQYDRKVRATLCHKIMPTNMPYGGSNVINGISRAENWPNIWISDPAERFPQSLFLKWESPRTISEIYLTFDTDLDAPDRCYGWPREEHRFVFPVAECVKCYRIYAQTVAGWIMLESVDDNYNRRRVHHFRSPVTTGEIKIEVLATHGAPSARIYEVRAYERETAT